jgi:hypothetical protein
MKNWIFASLTMLLFLAVSCSKHSTPRRVKKVLPDGSWSISSFTIEGQSVIENYAGYKFSFDEGGSLSVTGTGLSAGFSSQGSWETGLDRNPCILYLSFLPEGGLEYMADDWQVSEVKKDAITLKRNGDSSSSNLTLKR